MWVVETVDGRAFEYVEQAPIAKGDRFVTYWNESGGQVVHPMATIVRVFKRGGTVGESAPETRYTRTCPNCGGAPNHIICPVSADSTR